jgi:para-aminobenzoate synthetase component 1
MDLQLQAVELSDIRDMAEIFDEIAHLPYSCFLDSSLVMPRFGSRSFIGFDPYLVLATKGYDAFFLERGGEYKICRMNPLDALRTALKSRRLPPEARPRGLPPFSCGGIGFLAYELGRVIEKLPGAAVDDLGLPELAFCFFDRVIACDHATGEKTFMVAVPAGEDPELLIAESLARIRPGTSGGASGGPPRADAGSKLEFDPGFTREEYIEAVLKVKEYILAGDIYQANLSQRFSAPLLESAWQLYRRLRRLNPAPFSAYLNFGGFSVASSSPERFLKVSGRRVETRPIKGTRPRSSDPASDARLKDELLTSKKDRAELSMIVDLERNDIGRVCEYGSVEVAEHAVLESYATVHHLVSTVVGNLHKGKDMIDLLKATFPGGSITGAPKIRAMEIIDELEPTERSVYTGGIGYLGFDGNHDLNVAIRTMIIRGCRTYFQVGGGIVADSEPDAEYQETLDKGKAMFESITGSRPGYEPVTLSHGAEEAR